MTLPASQPWVRNPLIVSLDLDDPQGAVSMAKALSSRAGAFKVGPRLVLRGGAGLVSEISRYAPVFVDQKFFDIPSTMEAAIEAAFEAGASLATVHALAGREALERLYQLEKRLSARRPFKVLAVTLLTSFSQDSLPLRVMMERPPSDWVNELGDLAHDCGLSGFVCSGQEVSNLRARFESCFLVTPGIRLPGDGKNDQSRTMEPQEAMKLGSSALVVGRPIIGATDPVQAADRFLSHLPD